MKNMSITRRGFMAAAASAPAILTYACGAKGESADIVLFNGRILTLDSADTIAEAVAVRNGRILAAGSDRDILKYAGSGTDTIDLDGKTVLPGLIEGHAHPESASLSELGEALPNPRTVEECLAWIRQQAASKQPGEWVFHPKLFPTRLREMLPPAIGDIDRAAPLNPVFLNASYGAVVNSAAYRASGIGEGTRHPGLLRDPLTDRLDGRIIHTAFGLFKRPQSPPVSPDERKELLREMHSRYNRAGFTTVVSGGLNPDAAGIYDELNAEGLLTVRVLMNIYAPFPVPGSSAEEMRLKIESLGMRSGDGDEWVKTAALKTTVDGGILTGTAYLREPWGESAREVFGVQDPGYRGIPRMTSDEYAGFIRAAVDSGWRATAHCTGGGGVDLMLDACETVSAERDIAPGTFTIIHGNFFTAGAMERAARLGVTAEMQPAWFYKDADAMKHILGDERIRTFHPYRSMIDSGVLVSAGSDHMVILDDKNSINPYSPWLAVGAMVTRGTERGSVIVPEEAVSRMDALRCYTINNARAFFEEDVKGSIEPGKYADMIMIDRDFSGCTEREIQDIEVLRTIVGGKTVHEG